MSVSKYEIKAQKELEADGYIVDFKRGFSRWVKMRDYFNLFDLVAIKKGFPKIRWISIKGKAGIPGWHEKEIKEFWMPKGNIKEIWACNPKIKREDKWHKKTFDV